MVLNEIRTTVASHQLKKRAYVLSEREYIFSPYLLVSC